MNVNINKYSTAMYLFDVSHSVISAFVSASFLDFSFYEDVGNEERSAKLRGRRGCASLKFKYNFDSNDELSLSDDRIRKIARRDKTNELLVERGIAQGIRRANITSGSRIFLISLAHRKNMHRRCLCNAIDMRLKYASLWIHSVPQISHAA